MTNSMWTHLDAVRTSARLKAALEGIGINTPAFATHSPGDGAPVHTIDIGRLNTASATRLAKLIEKAHPEGGQ